MQLLETNLGSLGLTTSGIVKSPKGHRFKYRLEPDFYIFNLKSIQKMSLALDRLTKKFSLGSQNKIMKTNLLLITFWIAEVEANLVCFCV